MLDDIMKGAMSGRGVGGGQSAEQALAHLIAAAVAAEDPRGAGPAQIRRLVQMAQEMDLMLCRLTARLHAIKTASPEKSARQRNSR